jgi:hypothetical protein
MRAEWFSTKIYSFLFLVYLTGQLAFWYTDTRVPFRVTGEAVYTAAIPGETVKVEVPAKRDAHANCSVLFSRYMYDSNGTYYDLMATRFLSAQGIHLLDKINPNHVKFAFKIPEEATPGKALVVTQLSYMCNPLNYIWPIDYDMKITIEVEAKP